MAAHTFDDADTGPSEQPVSGWAVGGIGFAASILTLVGGFQVVAGLSAIIDDQFFVVSRNYAFHLDVSARGWVHLVLGLLLLGTGIGLFGRRAWGGRDGDLPGDAQRLRQLLLHPVLPVLGAPRDRPRRLGDLVADAAERDLDLRT
jgi:hypothetical protein